MSQRHAPPRPRAGPGRPGVQASTTVVTAIAAAEDVDPTELDVTLYDVIDPDALDALFEQPGNEDLVVEFGVGEYTVTVRGSDHVLVRPAT